MFIQGPNGIHACIPYGKDFITQLCGIACVNILTLEGIEWGVPP